MGFAFKLPASEMSSSQCAFIILKFSVRSEWRKRIWLRLVLSINESVGELEHNRLSLCLQQCLHDGK